MSERHHAHANGRTDPASLPAGDLAEWWDRRTRRRRTGSTQSDIETIATTVAVVAELEALSRADGLSVPRPGFLDDLERHLMDTPTAVLPAATPTPIERTAPGVRLAQPVRRSRALIDVLTVAAVLALLLGGSWSVLNDRATAPPEGPNGVAGVATPDGTGTPGAESGQVVALDLPWVENLPDTAINGVLPLNTNECVTPSRPAGSVEAALAERLALGDAAPTLEPEFFPDAGIDPGDYPSASDADITSAKTFFEQLSACRFETGDEDGTILQPYTGAFWTLYSVDAFNFDPVLLENRSVEDVVREQYSYTATWVFEWSYPATVLDVRQVPADEQGRARLLVTTTGSESTTYDRVSLLVNEEGQWRFLSQSLIAPERPLTLAAQVADIVLGRDAYGPRGVGNFSSQLEADYPVSMTIANVGETPQQVTVGGQDVGIVEPGASLVFQPFEVSPEAVAAAGDRLTFTVESVDLGAAADASEPRSLTIAVYPAGSLEYSQIAQAARTPAAEGDSPTGTPIPPAEAPESTPDVEVGAVTLDQPWAQAVSDEAPNGMTAVDPSACVTPAREPGSAVAAVSAGDGLIASDYYLVEELFPGLVDREYGDLSVLTEDFPAAPAQQLIEIEAFYRQVAACRFDNGQLAVSTVEPYTGAYWSLFSDDHFRELAGLYLAANQRRDVDLILRQTFANEPATGEQGAYPPHLLAVRTLPPTPQGEPRLLVFSQSSSGANYQSMDVLVFEGGLWRFVEEQILADVSEDAITGFAVDVAVFARPDGMTEVTVMPAQIEAETPVRMTIHNPGDFALTVSLSQQDLGVIEPGATIVIAPFLVPGAQVEEAAGRLDLQVLVVSEPPQWSSTASLQIFPVNGLAIDAVTSTGILPTAETAQPASGRSDLVTLDQPFAVPADVPPGVAPVPPSACAVTPREPGSVVAALEASPEAIDPLAEFRVLGLQESIEGYPVATDADRLAAQGLLDQLSACRFAAGPTEGDAAQRFSGPYWGLFSDEYFRLATASRPGETVAERIERSGDFTVTSGPYPDQVTDVRILPAGADGSARYLVVFQPALYPDARGVVAMANESGTWRALTRPGVFPLPSYGDMGQTLVGIDIDVATTEADRVPSGLEAETPIGITVSNTGETRREITIGDQVVGVVEPGGLLEVSPFAVPSSWVARYTTGFILTISSQPVGGDPPGDVTSWFTSILAGPGEPIDGDETGTPVPRPATPAATPIGVADTTAVAPDRVVEIDQPWAVSTGSETFDGVSPVSAVDCVTEPRASGALIDLIENAAARPVAELPEYLTDAELASLTADYPAAALGDLAIAQGFLDQWSSCRYAVGPVDAPLADRYTGSAWSLLSNDFLLREIPAGEGRTAESLVRQYQPLSDHPQRSAYPDQVVEVRSYPADALGQPRLLVVHRDLSPVDWSQVSLIVREGGTWRLAEYSSSFAVPTSGTPIAGETDPAGLSQIEVDVTDPANTVLEGRVFAGIPVAMTLWNPGPEPVSVRIGDQDLGIVETGQTVHIIPFTVPIATDPGTEDEAGVTITTTNDLGQEVETTWPVAPGG